MIELREILPGDVLYVSAGEKFIPPPREDPHAIEPLIVAHSAPPSQPGAFGLCMHVRSCPMWLCM